MSVVSDGCSCGFQLLNHNFKWKQQCDGLMRELESVKRQLVEYQQLTEIKLLEEREKTNRAVVSPSICVFVLLLVLP